MSIPNNYDAYLGLGKESGPLFLMLMMPGKSTVKYTQTRDHSDTYTTQKRGPNREHRCGASRIPSEGQVKTSHNSRVLQRGKIMRTLVDESIGAFIVVGHEHSLVGLEVFSFWEPPWIRWSVGRKLFHDAWVTRKYLINVVNLEMILELQSRHFMKASAYWRRQPLRNVTFRELFKAFHGQQRTDGSLADRTFPSASTVAVALCGRWFTLFLSPYQLPPTL